MTAAVKPRGGTAVMAQRVEAKDSLDDFPTPPWATRAVCELVDLRGMTVWEPCANRGYMVRPLQEYAGDVIASDVHDYGFGYPVFDFLSLADPLVAATGIGDPREGRIVDYVAFNPPFKWLMRFVEIALNIARKGVLLFARSAAKESTDRFDHLWTRPDLTPFDHPFVERVPLVRGRVDPKASTATSYSWFFLDKTKPRNDVFSIQGSLIPPCRHRPERATDYHFVDPGPGALL